MDLQRVNNVLLTASEDYGCTSIRVCPDQYWGRVCELPRGVVRCDVAGGWLNNHTEKRLIIVLESPHRHEFFEKVARSGRCSKERERVGPAFGVTGRNLLKSLTPKCPRHVSVDKNDNLIVMNAVQYQCSRGRPTTECRDKVFREIWNGCGGCEDFEDRLRNIIRPTDVIWNCCTKGNTGVNQLRILVHGAICKVIKGNYEEECNACGNDDIRYFSFTHPASWRTEFPPNPYRIGCERDVACK